MAGRRQRRHRCRLSCSTGSTRAWLTLRRACRCRRLPARHQTQRAPSCAEDGARCGLHFETGWPGRQARPGQPGSAGLLHLGHDVLDQVSSLGLPLGVGEGEARVLHRLGAGPQRLVDPARVAGLVLGKRAQECVGRVPRGRDLRGGAPATRRPLLEQAQRVPVTVVDVLAAATPASPSRPRSPRTERPFPCPVPGARWSSRWPAGYPRAASRPADRRCRPAEAGQRPSARLRQSAWQRSAQSATRSRPSASRPSAPA